MTGEYSVYSEFDLDKHKQTYVNYLEVLIDEDGTIMYAVPSHQEKAISLACSRTGLSRKSLDELCPQEYYGDYLTWLCMVAKVVFVWNGHCVAVNPTVKQIGSLRRLKMAGIYSGSIPQAEEKEYPTCLRHLDPIDSLACLLGEWGNKEEGE